MAIDFLTGVAGPADGWLPAVGQGALVLLAVELALLVIRRVRGQSMGLLPHVWALSLGCVTAFSAMLTGEALRWRIAAATAMVLTALVIFRIVTAILIWRPWSRDRDTMIPKLVIDVLRVVILVTAALVAATTIFDAELSTVLVSSTVLSAVVGFALQDTLGNVFAGMALQVERPFEIGDWLRVDDQPAQVIEMTWRSTRLRTNEGIILIEPNAAISARRLVSYGDGDVPVALPFLIGLPREIPPARVKAALLDAARSAPGAVKEPAPQAFVDEHGEHKTVYHLRVWTKMVRSLVVFRDSVQTRMWYSLHRHGIRIPFPAHTVQLYDMDKLSEQAEVESAERIAQRLAEIDFLHELAPATLERLAVAARREYYSDGEQLVQEAEEGDSLFIIEGGEVVVGKVADASGRPITLARLGEGDFFGEMSLLTGEPRSATVTASGGAEVIVLGRDEVTPVMISDPVMASILSRALAAREAETAAKVEDDRRSHVDVTEPVTEESLLEKIRSIFKLT